jgi:hypothetical protein
VLPTGLKAVGNAKIGSEVVEPGLDKHEWETWWQQFEEDVETSPAEALSELDRLTVEMLEARGYALDDPVAREGDDRDIIAEYVAAHETTEAVEQGKDVSREDIDAAIDGYRALHDYLLVERGAP